ncbi:MAG TPA: ABC transporter ATP-binding protein [Acidimicrobiales bacterium]|nr:ABC transporter ATP-binding protein [Acidimicrobiales bacterium]
MPPAVVVRDLVVRYGDLVAVDGVSFDASAGEVVALLGPNGAGKTSTVETAEGYRRPDEGRVRVLDLDPVDDRQVLADRVGVMPQGGGAYPGLRVGEALRLFASYYVDPDSPDRLLELLGLRPRERAPWRSLSGGEQQRLSLALAIVGRPDVAFLDEPTSGVDLEGRQVIRSVIDDLRARGVAVVLTTHELPEAEKVADRVVIIDDGRVVADGTPESLRTGGADQIRFNAAPGLDVAALSAAIGHQVVETTRGEYLVSASPTPTTVAAITAWLAERDLALGDLRAGRQSLEDVFLRLTRDSGPNADER